MVTPYKCRELHEQGWRFSLQYLDEGVFLWTTAQLTQGFEQGVVSFLASISFDALAARDPKSDDLTGKVTLELGDECGFPDAGLSGHKDDLPLATQCDLQALA